MVGLSGLEPPASRLSGVRSNQLSYRPTLKDYIVAYLQTFVYRYVLGIPSKPNNVSGSYSQRISCVYDFARCFDLEMSESVSSLMSP